MPYAVAIEKRGKESTSTGKPHTRVVFVQDIDDKQGVIPSFKGGTCTIDLSNFSLVELKLPPNEEKWLEKNLGTLGPEFWHLIHIAAVCGSLARAKYDKEAGQQAPRNGLKGSYGKGETPE